MVSDNIRMQLSVETAVFVEIFVTERTTTFLISFVNGNSTISRLFPIYVK